MVVVEPETQRHFTGLLDQNGQPIIATQVRETIGFYALGETDENASQAEAPTLPGHAGVHYPCWPAQTG